MWRPETFRTSPLLLVEQQPIEENECLGKKSKRVIFRRDKAQKAEQGMSVG